MKNVNMNAVKQHSTTCCALLAAPNICCKVCPESNNSPIEAKLETLIDLLAETKPTLLDTLITIKDLLQEIANTNHSHDDEKTLRQMLSDLCTMPQDFKQNRENCGRSLCRPAASEQEIREGAELTDDLVDAVDVQELFRITKSTYYRWVQKGILTPIKMNKKDFYRKSELQELLQRRKYRERGI